MNLDHDLCYTAIKSRDARFDGRFFIGVITTGIYCRPICPARCPHSKNVRFYSTAAAAAQAGFRPCLRCRPESSPGTSDWLGTSATVSRALRLISEGILDESGVDEIARRLHISPRQLRRLFTKHLGVSPLAVAQTRRLHFAKKLIDETPLSMTEVAFSAGFSSIRRFNAVIHNTYGRSPTELRKISKRSTAKTQSLLQLKLAYRPPYNWTALVGFLQHRAIPGVEMVSAERYRRTVKIADVSGIIEVRPVAEKLHLLLELSSNLAPHLLQIVHQVRSLFDLDTELEAINSHLEKDDRLAPLIQAQPGLRIAGAWAGFEIAVRAILGQQISVKAATTLAGRLAKTYGDSLPNPADELTTLFPTAKQLIDADLTTIGVIPKRAEAISVLAGAISRGELTFETATSLDEVVEYLIALPGIGPWTAHYIAMRAFNEPDAFPAGDLILRRAAAPQPGHTLTEAQLRKQAEMWRPWRAYAAMHLWQSYGTVSGKS